MEKRDTQRTRDEKPVPGTAGRTMSRRKERDEIEPDVAERAEAGAQSGGTRKVAVTNKKNKKRAA